MLVAYLGVAWLTGIAIGSAFHLPAMPAGTLALAGLAGTLGFWPHRRARLAAMLVLSLSLAVMRVSLAGIPSDPILDTSGPSTVTGTVLEQPAVKVRSTELRVAVQELAVAGDQRQVETTVLAWVPTYEDFRYGDKLRLTGRLQKPELEDNPAYGSFLARQGIFYVLYYPSVERLPEASGFHPLRLVNDLKVTLGKHLEAAVPAPESALLKGVLLGDRAAMPDSLREDFARTGTTHIIAISGQNMTLVAGLIILLAGSLGRRRVSLLLVIACITFYTVLVGAAPSVVRAAIMGLLWATARYFGRETDAAISVVLAGWLMTLHQPMVLWDIGFQLSFAATLGLIYLVPPLTRRLQPVPVVAREAIAVTVAAQAAVLPIQLHVFQQLPLVAVPANLLAAPALPLVMAGGALTALAGVLWSPLSALLAWPTWLVLAYMIRVVETFARVPFAAVEMPALPLALAWLWYVTLGLVILCTRRRVLTGGAAQAAALVRPLLATAQTLTFLSVAAVLIWVLVAVRLIWNW